MTKAELIAKAAQKSKVDPADVKKSLEAILDTIHHTAATGEGVFIRGFGSFQTIERKAKIGRNIAAGVPVHIPAKKIIKFKPAPGFNPMF